MRLALNFDAPEIEQVLLQYDPAIEIVKPYAEGGLDCEAEILLTPLMGKVPLPELLAKCRGLEWIHIFGTGTDSFPFDLAGNRLISCSRGASAIGIAEWVLAMMLNFEKQLPQSWVTSPPSQWFVANLGGLQGKTIGLLGFGSIGQEIAKRALPFDMRVLARVRTHRQSPMAGVELVESLETVLHEADHLVLALPATPESIGLMGAGNLAKTKRGVHLVNIARASLIDQAELRPLLDSGHIAMASLDVVEPEPLPAGHWLYSHPRVRLSPHVSWSAPGVVERILGVFLKNLHAFSRGQTLDGLVNVKTGY